MADETAKIRGRNTTSAEVKTDVLETALMAGHHIYESDRLGIDLFGGVRYWHIDGTVDFALAGPIGGNPSRHFNGDKRWLDPVFGARIEGRLGGSWYAGLLGDVGGFGVGSDLQWEILGKVGYRFDETWAVSAGYRHLTVDFDDDGFLFDATLTGPFLALQITF